jgi:N utilization substance protein B
MARFTAPSKPSAKARRSAARLAAVQALYQMAQTGQGAERVLGEFVQHRFGTDQDGDTLVTPDPALFGRIVRGASVRRDDLDGLIQAALSTGRQAAQLETLLRSVLRAGAWELLANGEVPAPIVITEYVNVADAFFSGPEPGIVNGVLDRLAHRLREGETGLASRGGGAPDTPPGSAADPDAGSAAETDDAAAPDPDPGPGPGPDPDPNPDPDPADPER